LCATLWRVGVVPGPWGNLRLERRIIARRLLAVAALAYLLLHAGFAAGVVWMMVVESPWHEYAWWGEILAGYIAPAALWPYGHEWMRLPEDVAAGVCAWVGLHWAIMPLLLLILDETMRRVRVRPVHLLRGVCYSSVPAAAWCVVLLALMNWFGSGRPPATMLSVALLLSPAWLGAWWYNFVKRYLRLPRAGVVVVLLMGVTTLASATVMLLFALLMK
jgi:hypothetical protein